MIAKTALLDERRSWAQRYVAYGWALVSVAIAEKRPHADLLTELHGLPLTRHLRKASALEVEVLLWLEQAVHRCPYCGSRETRLENIFGPTPCRSFRYCDSCRQPFEQFKTI